MYYQEQTHGTESLSELLEANKRVVLVGDVTCRLVYLETFNNEGSEMAWGEKISKVDNGKLDEAVGDGEHKI